MFIQKIRGNLIWFIPIIESIGLCFIFVGFNKEYLTSLDLLFPLILSLIVGFIAVVIGLVLKNFASGVVFVLFFYSYGLIANNFIGQPLKVVIFWFAWAFITILFTYLITKVKIPKKFYVTFCFVLLLTNVPSIIQIATTKPDATSGDIILLQEANKPNINIFILDRYARNDILEEYFDYDNSWFTNILEDKQFYVAKNSVTNFPSTIKSITSMLNIDDQAPINTSYASLLFLIENNLLKSSLENIGYNYQMMGSWWMGTSPNLTLNEFRYQLLISTALHPFVDTYCLRNGNYLQPAKVTLEQLEKLKEPIESPTIRIAHILCPHPPYVFDEYGNDPNPEDYTDTKYINQVKFINKKLLELIEVIDKEDIIIILSDEGPGVPTTIVKKSGELSNWSRLYTEEEKNYIHSCNLTVVRGFEIYDEITPVNVVRTMLNQLFGTSLPLVEDSCYMK